jgi:nicotinamidase-related amidase
MPTIDPQRSLLLVIDIQTRLMPAIHDGESVIRNAGRLIEAAKLIGVPRLFTEQNPKGLGPTVDGIAVEPGRLVEKQSFDVCREAGFLDRIPADAHVVVAGCEAHVCVLQTVLGLRAAGQATPSARARPRTGRRRCGAWSAMARRPSPPRWSSSNGSRPRSTRSSGQRSR